MGERKEYMEIGVDSNGKIEVSLARRQSGELYSTIELSGHRTIVLSTSSNAQEDTDDKVRKPTESSQSTEQLGVAEKRTK